MEKEQRTKPDQILYIKLSLKSRGLTEEVEAAALFRVVGCVVLVSIFVDDWMNGWRMAGECI